MQGRGAKGMALPTGDKLRAARALAGLKAAELATLAGINQSTLSRKVRSKIDLC